MEKVPHECLVCEQPHTDELEYVICESGEMFDVFLELGTVTELSMRVIRQERDPRS